MTKRWSRARREKFLATVVRKKAQRLTKEKVVEASDGMAENHKYRLVVLANNPNTGSIELHTEAQAESMTDLVPTVLDLLYGSGLVIYEVRLETL